MSDANFTWNVFYRGKEGFKEHLQATAENADALVGARAAVLKTLTEIGATPENDGLRGGGSRAPYAQRGIPIPASGPADPMATAAVAAGVAKVCPIHNVPLVYKAGGFSRNKFNADGSPKAYSASNRCPERNCTTIEWLS